MLTTKKLYQQLKERFPNIMLMDKYQTLHGSLDAFRLFTQKCIDEGNFKLTSECFSLVEYFWQERDFSLKNEIQNTYLYGLHLAWGNQNDQKARYLLPSTLVTVWQKLVYSNYP